MKRAKYWIKMICWVGVSVPLLIGPGPVRARAAAGIDCERFLRAETLEGADQTTLGEIQTQLIAEGYYKGNVDEIAGPRTLQALKAYCDADQKAKDSQKINADKDDIVYSYQIPEELFAQSQTQQKILEALKALRTDTRNELIRSAASQLKQWPGAEPATPGYSDIEAIRDSSKKRTKAAAAKPPDAQPNGSMTAPPAAEPAQGEQEIGDAVMYKLSDRFIGEIEKKSLNVTVLKRLRAIVGVAFATRSLFRYALDEQLELTQPDHESAEDHRKIKAALLAIAKREHPPASGPMKSWQGRQCGCVPNFTRITYGFFPYWLMEALPNKDGVSESASTGPMNGAVTMEFSALSRIGIYKVHMNTQGQWAPGALWAIRPDRARLIQTAHRYGSRVDLVVSNANWLEAAKNKDQVIAALSRVLTGPPGYDGITLCFESFPDAPDGLDAFRALLSALRKASNSKKKRCSVNLMFPSVVAYRDRYFKAEAAKGEKQIELDAEKKHAAIFAGLFPERLSEQAGPDQIDRQDPVDLLLVFLNPQYTYTKKELRYLIEREFHGIQRKTILRKIVPVITPLHLYDPADIAAYDQLNMDHALDEIQPSTPMDEHRLDIQRLSQFADDLIYAEDNFGGIGFWPVPAADHPVTAEITRQLRATFIDPANLAFLQRIADNQGRTICNFVCPHRRGFKIVFSALLIFLAAWGAGSLWVCKMRNIYKRWVWLFFGLALVAILIMIGLLLCDPAYTSRSTEIFLALILGLIVYLIYKQVQKTQQAKYP